MSPGLWGGAKRCLSVSTYTWVPRSAFSLSYPRFSSDIDPEFREHCDKYKANRRDRYATDPEYKRRVLDRKNQLRRRRYATDAQYREKKNYQTRMEFRIRMCTDPEYRKRLLDNRNDPALESKLDPDKNKKLDELWKKHHKQERSRKYANDHHHKQGALLRTWMMKNPWVFDQLEWKTHTPLLYPEKVSHLCSGCGYQRLRGLKLWFQRKDDPSLYDCFACFVSDWTRAMPIGYENVELGTGKRIMPSSGPGPSSPGGPHSEKERKRNGKKKS